MDRASQGVLDPRIGEPPSPLFIYLFVWDRCVALLHCDAWFVQRDACLRFARNSAPKT
jgi:hypothetical protein